MIDTIELMRGHEDLTYKYFVLVDNKPYCLCRKFAFSSYSKARVMLVKHVYSYIYAEYRKLAKSDISSQRSNIQNEALNIVDDLLNKGVFQIRQLLKEVLNND